MGYTHYFRDLQPNEDLAEAARAFIDCSGVSIASYDGYGEPVLTDREISLNGDASRGEDYESFCLISGRYEFMFCKTGYMPYDKVVTAILIRALLTGAEGSENISSDGSIADWVDGVHLYERVYGTLSDGEFLQLCDALGHPRGYDRGTGEWVTNELSCRADYEDVLASMGVEWE